MLRDAQHLPKVADVLAVRTCPLLDAQPVDLATEIRIAVERGANPDGHCGTVCERGNAHAARGDALEIG